MQYQPQRNVPHDYLHILCQCSVFILNYWANQKGLASGTTKSLMKKRRNRRNQRHNRKSRSGSKSNKGKILLNH